MKLPFFLRLGLLFRKSLNMYVTAARTLARNTYLVHDGVAGWHEKLPPLLTS
jgi:hypothetical protein